MGLRKHHHKASEGDGIPGELFQTLKDDDVRVLHSICQQIWKTQQLCMNMRVGLLRNPSADVLMLLNCDVGEDS